MIRRQQGSRGNHDASGDRHSGSDPGQVSAIILHELKQRGSRFLPFLCQGEGQAGQGQRYSQRQEQFLFLGASSYSR